MKCSIVFSLVKQVICIQFGFKKLKKRFLAVYRVKMEKALVKNQLCLKRLLMNGKQTKLALETLRCKSLDQRLFAQVMYVRLVSPGT